MPSVPTLHSGYNRLRAALSTSLNRYTHLKPPRLFLLFFLQASQAYPQAIFRCSYKAISSVTLGSQALGQTSVTVTYCVSSAQAMC